MVKCPKCNREIDHLHYYVYEFQRANFWVRGKDKWEFTDWKSLGEPSDEPPEFRCPECDALLFKGHAEASTFLLEGEVKSYKKDKSKLWTYIMES